MGYDIKPLQSYHPDRFWLAPKTHNVLLFPTFGRNGCLFPDKINFLILSNPPYASLWSFLAHETLSYSLLEFCGVGNLLVYFSLWNVDGTRRVFSPILTSAKTHGEHEAMKLHCMWKFLEQKCQVLFDINSGKLR